MKQAIASRRLFEAGSEYGISALSEEDGLVALTLEERGQDSEAICSSEHRIRVEAGKIAEHWGVKPLFSAPRP